MKSRSKEKELMDLGPDFYTPEEYAQCLRILFKINKLLGFYRSTVRFLKQFSSDCSLVDVGCGGGLFLSHLSRAYPEMKLLGIDVSPIAIQQAKDDAVSRENLDFQLQQQLALNLPQNSVDIVLITLVCHHVDDEDLTAFLQNAWQAARQAVIINDLHRHVLAYWFYKKISLVLFRNRLITHDGLISIKRGFTRAELRQHLKQAGIVHYEIKWGFPFRWRVVLWKK